MADLRDLPGELNVVLYVGRPTTLTLTWPTSLAGKTYTCQVSYGGAAPVTYSVTIATVTMTIALAVADYAAESGPGTITIIETTGGLTTPIIVGKVNVVRGVTGTPTTTTTVNVSTSTVAVSIQTMPPTYPTYATVAARTTGIAAPVAGNGAYLSTPKIMTWYNGASWDGQVPTFATTAARDTAIPTPDNGMLVRITATQTMSLYAGGWIDGIGGTTFNDARYAPKGSTTTYSQLTATATTVSALTTIVSLVVPAQPMAGTLVLNAAMYFTKSVTTDQFDVAIYNPGAASIASIRTVAAGGDASVSVVSPGQSLAAGTSATYTLRIVRALGAGTATTFNIGNLTYLTALFVPS